MTPRPLTRRLITWLAILAMLMPFVMSTVSSILAAAPGAFPHALTTATTPYPAGYAHTTQTSQHSHCHDREMATVMGQHCPTSRSPLPGYAACDYCVLLAHLPLWLWSVSPLLMLALVLRYRLARASHHHYQPVFTALTPLPRGPPITA